MLNIHDLPKVAQFAVLAVLVVLIGYLDYLTGPDIEVCIFYLVPIIFSTYLFRLRTALLFTILCVTVWLLIERRIYVTHIPLTYDIWNTLFRLGFFLLICITVSSLRKQRARQREMMEFIVHDVRSPLANVFAAIKILEANKGGKLDALEEKHFHIALGSCQWVDTVITSLLDLFQIEDGNKSLRVERVSPDSFVAEAINMVELWAMRKNIRLETSLADDMPTLLIDHDISLRVLVNLLGNAIKQSTSGSVVKLAMDYPDHEQMVFSVIDHGSGIPHEWVTHIFNKHVQVEAWHDGVISGHGLGLTFCRAATEMQGGRIWVESTANEGTIIKFTLPVQP